MYYLPEPPFLLLVFGLFAGITCGVAFEATLKAKVKQMYDTQFPRSAKEIQNLDLFIPFLGICVGICVFLAAGLEIFSIRRWLSYGVSLPLTVFIGWLIWYQLGQLLLQLQEGGSRALDLDVYGE